MWQCHRLATECSRPARLQVSDSTGGEVGSEKWLLPYESDHGKSWMKLFVSCAGRKPATIWRETQPQLQMQMQMQSLFIFIFY